MVFHRPGGLEYPKVWRTFSASRGDDVIRFRIQDLTEDLYEDGLQLLVKHFTKDEPPCKHIGINNHPSALKELEKLWRNAIEEKLSVVCLVDEETSRPRVVGINVLSVICSKDKDEPFRTEDKVWAKLFGAVDHVSRSVNIFQKYKVDMYLNAYGLVVAPEFRGMSVGTEILLARYPTHHRLITARSRRIPLCKALGIRVTATVFTAASSQVIAKKAGFVDLCEVSYEELASLGFDFPGVSASTKSSKLMALVIDDN